MVEVDGATDASVSVSVDGSRLRPPVLGVPRQMDPGAHRVVVEQDGREPFSVDIQLDEREREVLRPTLRERRRHGALVDPAGPVGASPGPSTPTPSRDGGRIAPFRSVGRMRIVRPGLQGKRQSKGVGAACGDGRGCWLVALNDGPPKACDGYH